MYRHALKSLLAILVLAVSSFAQRDLATILGTVTDPQGAVVPNAKVTITEDATGVSYEVTADSNGEYIRPLLKPGVYTITVAATGYKKAIQKNIELTGGGRIAVPVTLAVGEVSQTIEVTESAPLLQTESTVIGKNINSLSDAALRKLEIQRVADRRHAGFFFPGPSFTRSLTIRAGRAR